MKHFLNRHSVSPVLAVIAVLLVGLAPVSAEPMPQQFLAIGTPTQPVPRTFATPAPLTAEELAFEPPSPQPDLPPGAIALEIKITAIVPPMRHIVVDPTGAIIQITSNTLEDVEPKVYVSDILPENQRPLTDELYQQYRSAVPIGSAARGILYERGLPVAIGAAARIE